MNQLFLIDFLSGYMNYFILGIILLTIRDILKERRNLIAHHYWLAAGTLVFYGIATFFIKQLEIVWVLFHFCLLTGIYFLARQALAWLKRQEQFYTTRRQELRKRYNSLKQKMRKSENQKDIVEKKVNNLTRICEVIKGLSSEIELTKVKEKLGDVMKEGFGDIYGELHRFEEEKIYNIGAKKNIRESAFPKSDLDQVTREEETKVYVRKKESPGSENKKELIILFPLKIRHEMQGLMGFKVDGDETLNVPESEELIKGLQILSNQTNMLMERARLYEKVSEMSIYDGLTGLYNKGRLREMFEEEKKRMETANQPLSFLMIDIDHFKKFNDNYGHQVGDEVLKGVAEVLKKGVRESDVVARFGGEEFSVIAPKTELLGAESLADRLREMVADYELSHCNQKLSITVSVGAACLDTDDDFEELIDRADAALYRAKEAGRNCVVAADNKE